HHLRDREPRAVAPGLQADEPVADARERREQHPVGDVYVADAKRGGERWLSHHWLRSQIKRRPVSVSRSSTSSISSQNGTIAAACPPVATNRTSEPSSRWTRRAIASTAPANPYVMPESRLCCVLLPMTPPASLGGSPSSMGGSLAV